MANEAYRAVTAQDLIKMYNLDALITDRKQTKATNEKIQALEETSNSLKDFAEEVEKQIEELEKIADGKITTYYYSGVPTLTTYPTNEWALDEYENHIGDMYYDKETGYAYKFLFDNELNEYLWRRETNPELIEALAKANSALETAESAQSLANSANSTANSANQTATNAQQTANTANQNATNAQQTANSAQESANSAQGLANSANEIATSAQNTANTASQTANSAQTSANTANETANNAKEIANSAQGVANSAQSTANQAQQTANQAQTTAGQKMQVFIQTPYPPYKIGDLWFKDDKVIYRCRAEKESGSYSETDWKVATDFTNDDYAKNVEEQFNQYKVTVEKDYATKVQLETTKDEINLSVEGLTTKTETLENELKGKADVLNVTELTQRVDLVQSATELNVTAIEKLETNDVEQAKKMAEFEVSVDEITTTITDQEDKISKVTQTVGELNSQISDIADITISAEGNNGQVELNNINQSEPIQIVLRPNGDNISLLYPLDSLYPSDTLYPKERVIRFTNLTTQEEIDYELPMDLFYYDSANYDEFLLDYDEQKCVIHKRVGYNADGTTYVLDTSTTLEFEYPEILLTDGDYLISIPNNNTAYLFVRLMEQNTYTKQFATRVAVSSEINQTAQEISLEVSQKVGKDEVVSSINNAVKDGKGVIELVSNSVVIDSDNFKLDKTGRIDATSGEVGGFDLGTESFTSDIVPKKDYTQEDVSKLARYTVEGTGLTDEEKELYDVTGDGLLKVNDVAYMQKLISTNVSTTKPGKLEINSKNPVKTILIKDGDGKEVVRLGLLGIETPELKADKLSVSGGNVVLEVNIWEATGSEPELGSYGIVERDFSAYKYVDVYFRAVGVKSSETAGNGISNVLRIDLGTPSTYPIITKNGVTYHYGASNMYPDAQFFVGVTSDPGFFMEGAFIDWHKSKLMVGNLGYYVISSGSIGAVYGDTYEKVYKVVGYK